MDDSGDTNVFRDIFPPIVEATWFHLGEVTNAPHNIVVVEDLKGVREGGHRGRQEVCLKHSR